MKRILPLLFVLVGCSHAGPYVTGISSNGRGGLDIEKCDVVHNSFTGAVYTGRCSTQHIYLGR